MNGGKPHNLILQNRDRQLLAALAVLRFVDHRQARLIAGFSSDVRVRARLLQLVRGGHLKRSFVGTIAGGRKAVYCLNSKALRARDRGGVASPQTELFVAHELAISDVYIAANASADPLPRVAGWEQPTRPVALGSGVIPDAFFESESDVGRRAFFLEVDRGTESMSVWAGKIHRYLELARSGRFHSTSALQTFRVLVVAESEDRIQAIRSLVARSTDKVFYVATMKSISERGFWSPIWLPPTGDRKLALT